MPPLYLYNNKLLVVNSALAAAQDCCCSDQDCPEYLRISWSATGSNGVNYSGSGTGFQFASVSIPTSGGGGRPFTSISVTFESKVTSGSAYSADNNCVRLFRVYCRSGPSASGEEGKTALPNYISTAYGDSTWGGSGRLWFGGTDYQTKAAWSSYMQTNQTTPGRADGGSGYPRRYSSAVSGSQQTWDFLKSRTSSSTVVDFGLQSPASTNPTNPWQATLTIRTYP